MAELGWVSVMFSYDGLKFLEKISWFLGVKGFIRVNYRGLATLFWACLERQKHQANPTGMNKSGKKNTGLCCKVDQ